MNISKNYKPHVLSACALIVLGVCSPFSVVPFSPAWSQDVQQYRPQLRKILYRKTLPTTIRRAARKVGPTRFFGSFRQGDKIFAVHLYDTSRVRLKRESNYERDFERDSRLDVFQLTAGRTWQEIQHFTFIRSLASDEKQDKMTIEAQSLWLNPNKETLPLLHLRIQQGDERIPVGNRTDIYGVLLNRSNIKSFIALHGYIPYNPSTVLLSEISYPNANGHLTVLDITSDPGETSCIAYGWSGESWKAVGKTRFKNGFETALRWNGTHFVPMAKVRETP